MIRREHRARGELALTVKVVAELGIEACPRAHAAVDPSRPDRPPAAEGALRRRAPRPRRVSGSAAPHDVDDRFLGGVLVGPVYFVIGPDPGLVTSTGLTATPPIQLPVGVTAGGAELSSLMTSSPSNPK